MESPFGSASKLEEIKRALTETQYALITITHVDTSSGVVQDIKSIAELVQQVSPSTLIAIDGVCSVAAQEIQMDAWGLDIVMTASQKALGTPPGLAVMVVSQRALNKALNRTSAATSYFGSFKKWLPIMQKYEGLLILFYYIAWF